MNKKINKEIKYAQKTYGHYNSTHEVYGVLMEEVDEFWDLVKMKTNTDKQDMISELIQISAIAKRAAMEIEKDQIKYV